MVGSSRNGVPSWIGMATATRKVDIDKNVAKEDDKGSMNSKVSDIDLSFGERALSAAGAAFISAIVVNPLDVAKTRLQAQAAGVPYDGLCEASCSEASTEGFSRLWRGTNASLALAIPSVGIYMPLYDIFRNHMEELTLQNAPSLTPYVPLVAGAGARSVACITCYPVELARTRMQAFQHSHTDIRPPGVWKTLIGVLSPVKAANNHQAFQNYRMLWTGLGAQLSRDVPFSAVCWSSLEPLRRKILSRMGDEASALSILGANFCAGFVAGGIAAGITCPLDVARTRRQIEKDPRRVLSMTTRKTLIEIWRDGGIRGLFAGAGARVARTGPSVGIVVSFYEVVKHVLHYRQSGRGAVGMNE
ncbi:mitochondrial carrier protein MTM1-like isoform X2 [Andrographis paniculata]|uniref:mitochondrial carrier protein MTM1-like isoform X2 n=1 Tax=Andrographis paniculata TaxID=175694 RepID=UPI0021E8FAFD|nr:mitochondrial carrier protein MTM1-like isoform X2 [Andrographis paniculata]